jgi:uncharacterized protein YlzI (FlbEa/FlbD family)
MAFVQFTRADGQPVVVNSDRIIAAEPVPADGKFGQGTRFTFTNGGQQDVQELVAEVLRRLNVSG